MRHNSWPCITILTVQWSFRNYASAHRGATFGQWLLNTALFEEAWSIVCDGPAKWWISSWICIWSVFLTAVIYRESEPCLR